MRRWLGLGALLLCGCPSTNGDAADQSLGGDLAGAASDLAGGASNDLAGAPPDAASPPDLADPDTMQISWALWDSRQSAQRIACDDPRAQVTKIVVTAQEIANGAVTTTELPCPAGQMFGDGTIKLSNSMGTFQLTGSTSGMVMGSSDPVMATPTTNVSLEIYLF